MTARWSALYLLSYARLRSLSRTSQRVRQTPAGWLLALARGGAKPSHDAAVSANACLWFRSVHERLRLVDEYPLCEGGLFVRSQVCIS